MAILPNLEVVNHLITRFRGGFPSRGSLASAAGGYIARRRRISQALSLISRALRISLFFGGTKAPPYKGYGFFASAAGGYIARRRAGACSRRLGLALAANQLSLISRALRISLFPPLSQHTLTALPEGEPLRENNLRQALLGENSRNAGERG